MKPSNVRITFLIFLLIANLTGIPSFAQEPATPMMLNIVIVEGDGAINNIKQRVNREQIIQVEDENHKPIAGAAVVFFLPNQGPGGTYPNGSSSLTTTTDQSGRAFSRGIRYNTLPGMMQIRVTASFKGVTSTTLITQTNVLGAAAIGLGLTAKILIGLAVAGGAAAAGTVIANRGSSSSTPTQSTTTISAGNPSVGAP
ncbi:MAG: hypothetical protein ABL995_04250 [Bryobacteraceae bacterium]